MLFRKCPVHGDTTFYLFQMKIGLSSVNRFAEEIFENIYEHKSKLKLVDYELFNFIFLR